MDADRRRLRRLLERQVWDLRGLELEGFRCWLRYQLQRWTVDPVFQLRLQLVELRRAQPELAALERQREALDRALAAAPESARLRRLERELVGAERAVAGLGEALRQAEPAARVPLRHKLSGFQRRRRQLAAEQAALLAASPERRRLQWLEGELARLREGCGVTALEARLSALLRRRGRRGGRAGEAFEQAAERLIRERLLPRRWGAGELRLLRAVRLGAAGVEFDQLLVRLGAAAAPVEVLAAVEVKRNPNDLAHGLRRRRQDLAWLAGRREGYRPEHYRNGYFASGHFDRPARHRDAAGELLFTADSFRHFGAGDTLDAALRRLWLVSRPQPLWGVSSGALARIAHRLATDGGGRLADTEYLQRLLRWCQGLAQPVEAPEVLRLYAGAAGPAELLLLDA